MIESDRKERGVGEIEGTLDLLAKKAFHASTTFTKALC
jgi:hypothetical protein